jgi:hypothetical protein
MSKSTLASGLKSAVAKANGTVKTPVMPAPVVTSKTSTPEVTIDKAAAIGKHSSELVRISAHYPLEVRCVLLSVQAMPENARKNQKQLLGEALNLLFSKYGKPQAYGGES